MGMFNFSRGTFRLGFVIPVLLMAGATRAGIIINGDVTNPGDPVVGIAATVGSATSTLASVGTLGGVNNYPAGEAPSFAIDNNTATKYLNFAKTGVGLITTLAANGPSAVVNGIRFSTANDSPERDPLTVVLEGTNSANATTTLNSTWTTLYNGVSGLAIDPGRNTAGPTVTFVNALPFSSYRLLVSGVRNQNTANSLQFSEVELIGSSVPEPTSLTLTGLAVAGLFARQRRKQTT